MGREIIRLWASTTASRRTCVWGDREEVVLWEPTAALVRMHTPGPPDESAYGGYHPSPRRYNARMMD